MEEAGHNLIDILNWYHRTLHLVDEVLWECLMPQGNEQRLSNNWSGFNVISYGHVRETHLLDNICAWCRLSPAGRVDDEVWGRSGWFFRFRSVNS